MGGYSGDNAWLGNAKRQSLFRANPGPIPWAGKPNTPGMDAPLPATANIFDREPAQPAAPVQGNQQFGQPASAQQPQAASLFSPPAAQPSAPQDLWGRTVTDARAGAIDDYRGQLDINRFRAAQGLQPLSWGHNDPSRAEMETMLRGAGYDTITGARIGERPRDYAREIRDREAQSRTMLANDPRTYQEQRLSSIFGAR